MQGKYQPKRNVWLAGAVVAGSIAGALSIASSPAALAQGTTADKSISLNFQNAPVTTVLKTLFTSVGANYSIDPEVQGSVNIALNNVPFSAALHSLLRSANPPLTYDLVDGVYHIKVKQVVANTPVSAGPTGTNTPDNTGNNGPTSTDNKRWYKLPIDHSDVSLILPYISISKGVFVIPSFNGQGFGGGGSGGGGGGFGGFR